MASWCPCSTQALCPLTAQVGAAVLGVPVKPTIKEVDGEGRVTKTLVRAGLWEVQTPQVSHPGSPCVHRLPIQHYIASGFEAPCDAQKRFSVCGMQIHSQDLKTASTDCTHDAASLCHSVRHEDFMGKPNLQVIRPALLREGFELIQRERTEVTDDVSIIEALGKPVKVTQGSYTNIKVTTPDDMSVVERFLSEHKGAVEAADLLAATTV